MAVYETVDPTNKPDEYGRVGVSPDTPVPVGLATKKDAPKAPAAKAAPKAPAK